ncbi:MAG: hypothetical protein H0U11_05020 [Chloroflexi bacterium]|nr:hypothetical protein [Chloroflexota bacterium]
MSMGFGRNPADWEERWAMAKERTRLNEERMRTGRKAGGPPLVAWLLGIGLLIAVSAVCWFFLGDEAGIIVLTLTGISLIAVSNLWR